MTPPVRTARPVRVWSIGAGGTDPATLVPVTAQLDTATAPCTSGITREARDRVRAAICNAGHRFPCDRLDLSAPALERSPGVLTDLAVAVAIIATVEAIPAAALTDTVFVGQLGLDGRVSADIRLAEIVHVVQQTGLRRIVVPADLAAQASGAAGVEVFAASTLAAVLAWAADPLHHLQPQDAARTRPGRVTIPADAVVREAVRVCAAGGHHLAVTGAAGAPILTPVRYLHALLPPLSPRRALDLALVRLRAGVERVSPVTRTPPLRELHHSVSRRTVFGTADTVGAGALADQGVLACVEFPHMDSRVRGALAVLTRDGAAHVGSGGDTRVPARFQLALTGHDCLCEDTARSVTGPHVCFRWPDDDLDACVDVRVRVQPGAVDTVSRAQLPGRAAVLAARQVAAWRWSGLGVLTNARMPIDALRGAVGVDSALVREVDRLTAAGVLSIAEAGAVLAVAWTLCDLRGAPAPTVDDLDYALRLRYPSSS